MHIYNVKAALKDTFYGESGVLYGNQGQDVRALALMSAGIFQIRATNGYSYWYYFLKDIKNRDIVRFLMRRNGLRPEFHMSKYYDHDDKQPVFRVPLSDLQASEYLNDFTKRVAAAYADKGKELADIARYVDTITTKLAVQKQKRK